MAPRCSTNWNQSRYEYRVLLHVLGLPLVNSFVHNNANVCMWDWTQHGHALVSGSNDMKMYDWKPYTWWLHVIVNKTCMLWVGGFLMIFWYLYGLVKNNVPIRSSVPIFTYLIPTSQKWSITKKIMNTECCTRRIRWLWQVVGWFNDQSISLQLNRYVGEMIYNWRTHSQFLNAHPIFLNIIPPLWTTWEILNNVHSISRALSFLMAFHNVWITEFVKSLFIMSK